MLTQRNADLVGQLKVKEIQLHRIQDESRRRFEAEAKLKTDHSKAIEEKDQVIFLLHKQLEEQKASEISQIESREKTITELFDKLQVTEHQCAVYKMDFETERHDRESLHQKLSHEGDEIAGHCQQLRKQLDDAGKSSRADKKALAEAQHNIQHLREQNEKLKTENDSLNQLNEKLTDMRKSQKEEIQILTAQVNAYSRKGDELKRALTESQERYKTLETEATKLKNELTQSQETNKTSEAEVGELLEKLERKRNSKQLLENQLTILRQQEQAREQEVCQLQQQIEKLKEDKEELQKEVGYFIRLKTVRGKDLETVNVHDLNEDTPQSSLLVSMEGTENIDEK